MEICNDMFRGLSLIADSSPIAFVGGLPEHTFGPLIMRILARNSGSVTCDRPI